uniref:Uncharacterized protein n=1 Tax=Astyanax mexicanus TaxID=7994 RepID=A0A8B9JHS1_ASTMX
SENDFLYRLSHSLFTDIQEFYEVTLLNTQKSCEQKLEEIAGSNPVYAACHQLLEP